MGISYISEFPQHVTCHFISKGTLNVFIFNPAVLIILSTHFDNTRRWRFKTVTYLELTSNVHAWQRCNQRWQIKASLFLACPLEHKWHMHFNCLIKISLFGERMTSPRYYEPGDNSTQYCQPLTKRNNWAIKKGFIRSMGL